MSDRIVRFPDSSWQEVEALPEPLRWTVQRAIFPVLDEPTPTLADPFPQNDPLPGAYELHLPADHVTVAEVNESPPGTPAMSVSILLLRGCPHRYPSCAF